MVVILLEGYVPTSLRAGSKRKSSEHRSDASDLDEKKLRAPDRTDLALTSGKHSNLELCQQDVETSKTLRQAGKAFCKNL